MARTLINEKAAMFFFVSDAFRVMWAEHSREIRVCALEVFLHVLLLDVFSDSFVDSQKNFS